MFSETAKHYPIVGQATVGGFLDQRLNNAKFKYRACGIGATDNKGTLPKGVLCTDVNVVASDKCLDPQDPTKSYEVPETFACIQWPAMENNLCAGDYGGKFINFCSSIR
jgi:hypothetical protein